MINYLQFESELQVFKNIKYSNTFKQYYMEIIDYSSVLNDLFIVFKFNLIYDPIYGPLGYYQVYDCNGSRLELDGIHYATLEIHPYYKECWYKVHGCSTAVLDLTVYDILLRLSTLYPLNTILPRVLEGEHSEPNTILPSI